MSTQVQPEEAQAILDAVQAPGDAHPASAAVAARDFGLPLRLSSGALAVLRKQVNGVLAVAEKELSRTLRGTHTLALTELREINAQGLFEDLGENFALLRFEVDGQPGWLQWDNPGAVAAVEIALGAPEPTAAERKLSGVERRIVGQLMGAVLTHIASAIGIKLSDPRMIAKRDDVGAWNDVGARADRARLRVHLEFEGPGGASAIDLYLPGVRAQLSDDDLTPAALPAHLIPVNVELAARLGACDIPLGELLQLEVGDVIPLDAPEDGSLNILVEEVTCARARWGTWRGQLAIQILDIGRADSES